MPEGYRFSCPIRVRYSEIDRQGIVYNSRYLEYVDVALAEYFRALGVPYPEMVERHGFDPSLVKATLEFKAPARLDEDLRVHGRVTFIGRSSFSMEFQIVRQEGGGLVTGAEIVYVNFETATQSSRPVPEEIRRRIEAFERTTFPVAR
jgi:acyl-CoA thioester hydrolase